MAPSVGMGAGESKTEATPPPPTAAMAAEETPAAATEEEKFKEEVRTAAGQFKNLVQGNKVMMFSATYCTYCTVAKRTLEELGTAFQAVEVDKMGREGEMLMNVVSAVTGARVVPAIYICGQLVPGGGTGLRQLAAAGELTGILERCCDGDHTCAEYAQFRLHGH